MYSIYLSTSDLLSLIISNSDKHEFSILWKLISCLNDVMNHVHCVIKRDVYPHKMHSCYKNIRGILQIIIIIIIIIISWMIIAWIVVER